MSTKIQTGYRIDGISAYALLARLKKFAEEFRRRTYTRICSEMAERISRTIDTRRATREKLPADMDYFEGWPLFTSVYYHFRWKVFAAYSDLRREPLYDFTQCDVSVFPQRSGDWFLLIFYDQSGDHEEPFEQIVKAKWFPYWNNTDRPDDVTAEQWRAREKLWDRATQHSGVPATQSFTYECMPKTVFPRVTRADVLKKVPSLKKRRDVVAGDKVLNAYIEKLKKTRKEAVQRLVGEEFGWMRTPEAEEKLRRVHERIDPLIRPLTLEDLEARTSKFALFERGKNYSSRRGSQ